MLCDELQRYSLDVDHEEQAFAVPDEDGTYMDASEVDAAIAELKKKLMPCLNGDCILTCEVVEKYGKENAELKQKLEDAQATAYAESVDAGMRERRLKRALYKACANWAKAYRYPSFRKFESRCLKKAEELK